MSNVIAGQFTKRSLKLIRLEVVSTDEQLRQGLMGRALLEPMHGMLFAFKHTGRHGFWMKNTSIPLDVAWLSADGQVQEIQQLFPLDETMHMPKRTAKYALEMNAGEMRQLGVRVGDYLTLFNLLGQRVMT